MKSNLKDFPIKDNRELMRNREREVCRVCGDIVVHSKSYDKPTMECIRYLRAKIRHLIGDTA